MIPGSAVGIGVALGVSTRDQDYNAVMVQDFGSTGANQGLSCQSLPRADEDGFYTPGEGLANLTVTPSRGNYYAMTSTSGGYAIPVPSLNGSIQVTFSNAVRGALATKSVTLVGENVKIDFEANRDTVVTFGFSGARRTANGNFEADLRTGRPATRHRNFAESQTMGRADSHYPDWKRNSF
jgi:hypothetical protein